MLSLLRTDSILTVITQQSEANCHNVKFLKYFPRELFPFKGIRVRK